MNALPTKYAISDQSCLNIHCTPERLFESVSSLSVTLLLTRMWLAPGLVVP